MRSSKPVRTAARSLLLATACLPFVLPLAWMVLASLKSGPELLANPFKVWWPPYRLANYRDAVQAMPFWRYLANSVLLSAASALGTVVSCALAAYAFARLRWPGRDIAFGLVIASLLLPWHVTMIPRFKLLATLGWYNRWSALIVPTFLGEAFFVFLLRQFFRTIPEEYSEAARLDGCSELEVFGRVVMPLARPAIAAVALLKFVTVWNDFSSPLLLLNDPERQPLAYGLEQFVSAYTSQTNLLMAASVLFTLPLVVLFFLAQRTFLEGITTTGIKG